VRGSDTDRRRGDGAVRKRRGSTWSVSDRADGIHSRIRQCLFGAGTPEFTGCVAWRGLIAMEHLPPHLSQLLTTNWLGPHGHVLHYPVRRGELMNFISFVERDDWQVESWIIEGTGGIGRRLS